MSRIRVTAALLLVVAGLLAPVAVHAAEPAFGKPTIDASFGKGITLTQPVTLDAVPARVELLLTYADASGPLVIEVPPPGAAGATTLRYTADDAEGHTLPNTAVEARWRITPTADAESVIGPAVKDVYDDQRFDWKTASGDIVRVHWYDGDKAFGERALRIGEEAIAETGKLLGVTETEPVDFFIYADQDAFYDALGPGTRENVGGQAVASIRTLFALIPPSAIDDPWVGIVVPHELTHLVFDTAASNPYHFPPRWLNEGLAVYLSQGYDSSDRSAVENAARSGRLIPLAGLVGQFPTSAEQFFQAYSESVSAVDFLIRTHGQDALVSLIRSYAEGRTDDEAFTAAIGMDTAAFDAAWLADLGAETPVTYGPQPAPAGPEPGAWTGSPGAGTPPPNAGSPGASHAGGGTVAGEPSAPVEPDSGPPIALIVVIALGAAVALAVVYARRRRGQGSTSP
jgi:Peptidase MA superfamily